MKIVILDFEKFAFGNWSDYTILGHIQRYSLGYALRDVTNGNQGNERHRVFAIAIVYYQWQSIATKRTLFVEICYLFLE